MNFQQAVRIRIIRFSATDTGASTINLDNVQ